MKKFLVVLLSLGLIVAFGMTASAADVKFSGQYYVVGTYENNRTLNDTDSTYSRASMWTRTRVRTDFQIAEGLSFTTRFDAFERQWGSVNRSSSTSEDKSNSGKINNTSVTLQENIEMEYGYVTFKTAIGLFEIGYQAADEWGTIFADTPGSRPRAKFTTVFGPVTLLAIFEKVYESDSTPYVNGARGLTDADGDNYMLAGVFTFKGGNAGLLYKYTNLAMNRPTANVRTQVHALLPYFKATIGPVYMEGEVVYLTGKSAKYEAPSTLADVDKDGLGAYIMAKVTLGPAYVGGQIGYSSGDPNDTTKDKSGPISTTSWVPTLFFANANMKSWVYGSEYGPVNGASYSCNKQNLLLYNVFGGFNPTAKLNIETAFSYLTADKKPNAYVSDKYGMELDLKATYKIYDNLTYMVGAGYFWTGDYFKGTSDNNKTGNDYVVLNQLTLNF
jgi:hypothetical protein